MNKTKKIAVAAVSVVMAGTMVLSFAACGNKKTVGTLSDNKQTLLTPTTDSNGALSYASGTKLTLSIGYNSADTGITYSAANATKMSGYTLMGSTVRESTLKPAWDAFQKQLDVTFEDIYDGTEVGKNIATLKSNTAIGGLSGVTLFTASVATINQEGVLTDSNGNRESLLDISQYLDYMPNYKAFLESSPIIQASLIADADSGSMYMVPYFDGNDDIEKFVLMRKDLVETLLDGKTGETFSTTTFADQADAKNNSTVKPTTTIVGTSSSVTSFMGTTGSWKVATTDPSVLTGTVSVGTNLDEVSNATATVNVVVNYDKALAAAKDVNTTLGAAINEAAGKVYNGTSGNIVDLQNFAINETSGAVTGGSLLKILRAYIDVAYTNEAGSASFYTSSNSGLKRSDVFNSACGAWDADLYTALGRCFVTCGSMLGSEVKDTNLLYLIAGREYTTQRTTDVGSLAGELYGVRGLESRYNYSYIDNDGNIVDTRANEDTWEALVKINDLAKEGLFNTTNNILKDKLSSSASSNTGIQTLSLHDYVQTQTSSYGFSGDDNYNFAPIVTSVSAWDVDGKSSTSASGRTDGKETIMRFTESWRSVKDGGFAISYANVKDDPDKLAAALAFIDYMYSNDGQILMTYGPQSTTGNTNSNGLWYATEATGVNISTVADKISDETKYAPAQYSIKDSYKSQYFVYNGKVYTGTAYNGRQIPTMTDENLNVFNKVSSHNFTNHARQLLGTCLPVGNKDQGFEYQCTATCGIVGSKIVNIALNNGTIKHPFQTIDSKNYWYTVVPTTLPYDTTTTETLGAGNLALISGLGSSNDNMYVLTSKTNSNFILDIMYYGYKTSQQITSVTSSTYTIPANAAGCVELNNTLGLKSLSTYKTDAWESLLTWYEIVTA
jgi:putative aldouronate transport system substrate-binding protein